MNVLINGATGYIGQYLTEEMLNAGHRVYAVSRKNDGTLERFACDRFFHIVSEQCELIEKLSGIDIDVWYQLAWEGATGEKRLDTAVQNGNIELCTEAFKTAESIGCKKIIFTGTVYEKVADILLSEKSFASGSYYILAKRSAHDMTLQMSKRSNMKYIWCNFCHPVGAGLGKNQLMYYTCDTFVNDKESCFSSCDHLYDIISVRDLTFGLRLLGENDVKEKEYYIGHNGGRCLSEYIEEAASICGYTKEIGFGKRPDDGLVFRSEWFDSSKLCEETKWYEREGFEEAVRCLADSIKEKKS